ncbi:MAG: hypothetical protein HC837_11435 [Chloroflexaceae bacterium]|nr:hypothetical protein [Chloroflexaceae bacterium]
MIVQLTFCQTCTQNSFDFLNMVNELEQTYPHDLCVVQLNCIAACDEVPAVIIDYDFIPNISAAELNQKVLGHVKIKEMMQEMTSAA